MNNKINKYPLISIIVIGYNVENVIGRCLETISKQTYDNIEIIVVNDGSNDSTSHIVKSLGENDERIILIEQKNQGILKARKTGLKNANGEFVVFVDSDDWLHKSLVEKLHEVVAKVPNIDIVVSDNISVYDNIEVIDKYNNCKFNHLYTKYEYLELILKQKVVHNVFGKLYKREFLLNSKYLDLQDISMGEDLLAQVVFGINKPNVMVINDNLYYYIQDSDSYSHNNSTKIFELIDVLGYIEQYLSDNKLINVYEKEVEFLWFIICYFYYVVSISGRSKTHKRHFYDSWRVKKININDNILIKDYISGLDKMNRVLLYCYNCNFTIGFLVNKILLSRIKTKKVIKRWLHE